MLTFGNALVATISTVFAAPGARTTPETRARPQFTCRHEGALPVPGSVTGYPIPPTKTVTNWGSPL